MPKLTLEMITINRNNSSQTLFSRGICILILFFQVLFCYSQDITIGLFTDICCTMGDANIAMNTAANVTTFTATGTPAQITDTTLNKALLTGDVVINATSGKVIFTPGTFAPTTANRKLTIMSSGDASIAFLSNSNKIDLIVMATGDAIITGSGVATAGGEVDISGNNLTITGSGLTTGGGNAKLTALANLEIRGTGMRTNGGNIDILSNNITITEQGLSTGGGDAKLTALTNLQITGAGMATNGGNIDISAIDVNINSNGISTLGGYTNIVAKGNITIDGAGVRTLSGKFYASGVNFNAPGGNNVQTTSGDIQIELTGNITSGGAGTYTQMGGNIDISTRNGTFLGVRCNGGGNINLNLSGALVVNGPAVSTTLGEINITATDSMTFNGSGINASTSKATLCSSGNVDFRGFAVNVKEFISIGKKLIFNGGGIMTSGGDVSLYHTDDINLYGCGIQTSGGSLYSFGKNLNMYFTQILTNGGNASFCHTGNFDIDGGGIQTGTGTVYINTLSGNILIKEGGIRTDNQKVEIYNFGGTITLDGGNIYTGAGSGGVLTEMGSGITKIFGPDLGGGNVLLNTAMAGACPICPYLEKTVPNIPSITESTCDTYGGPPSGGIIAAAMTNCPTGSTLKYSVDNGLTFLDTLPAYVQSDAITVKTICQCDVDDMISSDTSSITTVPATVPGSCPVCPFLEQTVPNIPSITESTCDTYGGTPSGGIIAAPMNNCPTGSTLKYSVDNGLTFLDTLPAYVQSDAVTVKTICQCDGDDMISSDTSSITTVPGSCPVCPFREKTIPNIPSISESTCDIYGGTPSGGIIAAAMNNCPTGSTLKYSVDNGLTFLDTLPAYIQSDAITVKTICQCDVDDMISSDTSSITTVPGSCPAINTADITTYNELTFSDPCNCDDIRNCEFGGDYYFHDTLVIEGNTGLTLTITSFSEFYIGVPCIGGISSPTINVTTIPETENGIYKIEFWKKTDLQAQLAVTDGVSQFSVPLVSLPICSVSTCIDAAPIPTLGQWSIIILGLLILIIGTISSSYRVIEKIVKID